MTRGLIAVALGVFLGVAGARYQQFGFWTLLPWGAIGIAVGAHPPRREAMVSGALYGFALSFSFMIAAYTGTATLLSRLPFFALLGLFGALCGLLLGLVGFRLRART